MNYILFDGEAHQQLLPLSFTRPVADMRCGILTIAQKWEKLLGATISYHTQPYLQAKFTSAIAAENTFINGAVFPDAALIKAIATLKNGEALYAATQLIAVRLAESQALQFSHTASYTRIEYTLPIKQLTYPESIFSLNGQAIKDDFELLTAGKKSQELNTTNTHIGTAIFIEEGAKVNCAILNSTDGPIYIGKDAEVMEGAIIRGPFALGEHAQIKMGAKIYGSTTVGPHCKAGGEISNSVLMGFSNKGHDGFLGNSVVGEWCNLGADTNNSNLKNNYAEVKLWDYNTQRFRKTGLQFCGLIMADHAKCGINTMFNTGTVIGVSANIFGAGFPRNFVPDFSWGGTAGYEVYQLPKVYEVAELVMQRRAIPFTQEDKEILAAVFEQTETHRNF